MQMLNYWNNFDKKKNKLFGKYVGKNKHKDAGMSV